MNYPQSRSDLSVLRAWQLVVVSLWLLGIKPRSYGRAASIFNCWDISSATWINWIQNTQKNMSAVCPSPVSPTPPPPEHHYWCFRGWLSRRTPKWHKPMHSGKQAIGSVWPCVLFTGKVEWDGFAECKRHVRSSLCYFPGLFSVCSEIIPARLGLCCWSVVRFALPFSGKLQASHFTSGSDFPGQMILLLIKNISLIGKWLALCLETPQNCSAIFRYLKLNFRIIAKSRPRLRTF